MRWSFTTPGWSFKPSMTCGMICSRYSSSTASNTQHYTRTTLFSMTCWSVPSRGVSGVGMAGVAACAAGAPPASCGPLTSMQSARAQRSMWASPQMKRPGSKKSASPTSSFRLRSLAGLRRTACNIATPPDISGWRAPSGSMTFWTVFPAGAVATKTSRSSETSASISRSIGKS